MKKSIFGIAALALVFASCGQKAKTEAEITAEAEKMFNEKKAELQAEADKKCDDIFEGLKSTAWDSIAQANTPKAKEG